jgi:hypothetical protein
MSDSTTDGFVVVYHYHYWDEERRQMVVSQREATLQCIKDGLGIPIIESGRKVSLTELDGHGRVMAAPEEITPPLVRQREKS